MNQPLQFNPAAVPGLIAAAEEAAAFFSDIFDERFNAGGDPEDVREMEEVLSRMEQALAFARRDSGVHTQAD